MKYFCKYSLIVIVFLMWHNYYVYASKVVANKMY